MLQNMKLKRHHMREELRRDHNMQLRYKEMRREAEIREEDELRRQVRYNYFLVAIAIEQGTKLD